MSWNWTLTTALVGATTGIYGAVVSTLGRWDVVWRRRAKQIPTVRPALEALRDAIAEARQGNRQINSLRDPQLRAHREVLEEALERLSDRDLADLLENAVHGYSAVIAVGDDAGDHRKSEAIERTATGLKAALARVDLIEKKAPA